MLLQGSIDFKQLLCEIQFLLFDFLDEDHLNLNSAILNLRISNKYLYQAINSYWKKIYAIKQIICCDCNSYILLQNGDLYGCGINGKGYRIYNYYVFKGFSLGLSRNIEKTEKFVRVLRGINCFFAGRDMMLAWSKDNKLYGSGNTHNLGLNHLQDILPMVEERKKMLSRYASGLEVEHDYGKKYLYNYTANFQPIAENIEIKDIAVGYTHILILDKNSEVYACGYNCHGQLGIGHDGNLSKFTKIFPKADKIFATALNTFIVAENELYAAGGNYNFTIDKQLSQHVIIPRLTKINYVPNPENLKKIIDINGMFVFLYTQGDLYLVGFNQTANLIDNNVIDVWYLGTDMLILLKNNGNLIYLGSEDGAWLLNGESVYKLVFKFFVLYVGIKFLQQENAKRFMPTVTYICSNLIAEQVSNGSCCELDSHDRGALFKYARSSYINGKHLMFSKNQGTSLYASGIRCLDGQLALPERDLQGVREVFDNLPLKNKLLQGKGLRLIL